MTLEVQRKASPQAATGLAIQTSVSFSIIQYHSVSFQIAKRSGGRASGVVRYLQEPVLTKADLKETTTTETATPTWLVAVRAAEAKQAADLVVLDLTGITAFADYFVICTGANQKQVQAISDEVGLRLKHEAGELPTNIEGYNQAEWVLADYGDLLIHIFSPKSREYYGLERLWRGARRIEIPTE
jgi:ribosome-associated protein